MYTLKMTARDSYKALRARRTYARHNRRRNAAWFRPTLIAWAYVTFPIKHLMFSRANKSMVAAFGLSALATVAYA
jgi:hypothetical protein